VRRGPRGSHQAGPAESRGKPLMVVQPRFCGRCGAQVAPGAPFCGRCGAPVVAQALVAQPVYSYPMAQRAAYPTTGRYKLSQVAIAGGLLIILAVVTIALSALAVSHFVGGRHATCTVNCAPKIVTPLPEGASYHNTAFGYQLNYSSRWTVRSEDASGVLLGTRLGSVQVVGMHGGQDEQVLQATVSALPNAKWQSVTLVSNLKGAKIGDQDGVGAVYSANLVSTGSTAAKVVFAVIVASRNGVTVVVFAIDPADPNAAHGMAEGQAFDYMCTEFVW
jgi:zinc ribbon protein